MKAQATKTWTTDQLVHLSNALGHGYAPGSNSVGCTQADRWTVQRHIQASNALGQAFV